MSNSLARKRGRPRSFHDKTEANIVQSLDKALVILKAVANGNGMALTEIADTTGSSPASVYRALVTFQQHGVTAFDETSQLWTVGVEAFRIGTAFLAKSSIVERARPVMQKLMTETGETVNLGVVEGDEVVFLSQVETHEPIRAFFPPGSRGAIHASGIGKAVFAFLPEEQTASVLARLDLTRFTDNTITDRENFETVCGEIRKTGYAVDDEERTEGMRCVAAPVFNAFGEAIAAVSISGPSVRIPEDSIGRYGYAIREAATEITQRIGGRPPVSLARSSDE